MWAGKKRGKLLPRTNMKRTIVMLLHLGYWVMYFILLATMVGLLSIGMAHLLFQNSRVLFFFIPFAIVPATTSFYGFYTIVFDRFLRGKKIVPLFVSGLGISFASGLTGWLLLYLIWPFLIPKGGPALTQGGSKIFIILLLIMSLNALVNGIIALVMMGFINWYNNIAIQEELARKNYEMEMGLVKSQFNPHFLFNTLNNIDELIGTDADRASDYLHKLSVLYETKTDRIMLADELAYIEKYIDLQKIRVSNPSYAQFSIRGNSSGRHVAPMVFIPFVENAFKHASIKKTGTAIDIDVNIGEKSLVFTCENSCAVKHPVGGGLGNGLVKKRLELLYPGNHSLEIVHANDNYQVKLVIFHDKH
jgi:two-component system LytT family sensor kinase